MPGEKGRGPCPSFENDGGLPPMKKGGGTPLAARIRDTPLPPAGLFVVPDPSPPFLSGRGDYPSNKSSGVWGDRVVGGGDPHLRKEETGGREYPK